MGPVPGGPGGAGGSHGGGDTGAFDLFGAGCNRSTGSAGDALRASWAGATGGSAAVGTGDGR